MTQRLQGKVAIVTGGSRGIGEAVARLFVEEGAAVVVADVLDEEGSSVAAELGASGMYVHLDVGQEPEWTSAVAAATSRFGHVDVLVNNAAILRMSALEDTTLGEFAEMVAVNQFGPFLGMKAVIGAMRAAGGGSIINVSSIDGMAGMTGTLAYGATKFAVRGMSKVAALELGKYGIRVNSLHPGGVATPMNAPPEGSDVDRDAFFADQPIPRMGRPRELAQVALFLASDDSSYCTGAEFLADGGHCAGLRVPGMPGY